MKRFDWLHIKWNKAKTKLLTNDDWFPLFIFLMQISSYSWNSPGENVAEKTFSRIPIFKKLEHKNYMCFSVPCVLFTHLVLFSVREDRKWICTISSMLITTQLQSQLNCRWIARIFQFPENKTIAEKVRHVTAKLYRLKSFRKTGGKSTWEASVYLFVRILIENDWIASTKSSVVALAYDNLRTLLQNKQAETHQF